MWTRHGEILWELSSMLDFGTTNSWLRLRKGTVGYTRTRTTVCQPQPEILLFLTQSAGMMSAAASRRSLGHTWGLRSHSVLGLAFLYLDRFVCNISLFLHM